MPAAQPSFAPELTPTRTVDVRARSARVRVSNRTDAASQGAQLAIHESAAHTRRTIGWRAPATYPNDILGHLDTLRNRSRAAIRNDGYASSIVETLVSNIVGTGIKPLSQVADVKLRADIQALWLRWTDVSDADGQQEFYGQQTQAVRSWLSGGEMFVRLRPRRREDGLAVPLQVQLLESELRPHLYNSLARNGNRIRAGIEFDAIGRRTAYYFYRSRPGDLLDVNTSEMVRVPSPEVIHLFDPVRPGQLCGLPVLTRALISLHELDKFDDATLLRQQLQTMFVGFVKREPSLADPALDPMTGLEPQTDDAGRAMVAMEPGTFQELHPGEDVTFSEPPEAGSTYEAFMRQQLRRIAAGVFTPYELITGDMSALNDRTVRVILHDFRRKLQQWQHQIVGYQLCRRIWLAFLEAAVQDGALPVAAAAFLTERDSYAAVKWMPQGWPYIHPVQDVEAAQASVRNGFKTRSDVVNELGEDVELVDQGQAADNERADDLGLQYDSDGRKPLNAKAGAPPAQPGEVAA